MAEPEAPTAVSSGPVVVACPDCHSGLAIQMTSMIMPRIDAGEWITKTVVVRVNSKEGKE